MKRPGSEPGRTWQRAASSREDRAVGVVIPMSPGTIATFRTGGTNGKAGLVNFMVVGDEAVVDVDTGFGHSHSGANEGGLVQIVEDIAISIRIAVTAPIRAGKSGGGGQ